MMDAIEKPRSRSPKDLIGRDLVYSAHPDAYLEEEGHVHTIREPAAGGSRLLGSGGNPDRAWAAAASSIRFAEMVSVPDAP